MGAGAFDSPVGPDTLTDAEALEERSRNLGALNGMKLVLVSLQPPGAPVEAQLEVHFFNANGLADIVTDVAAAAVTPANLFPIAGGRRLRAGHAAGQVKVTAVVAGGESNVLVLTVAPIGDYSTYTLGTATYVVGGDERPDLDPVFSELRFKFRPGCFTTDCAPEWKKCPPAGEEPAVDYLAKDYDSFRHTLMAMMGRWVPGWRPTSEADLDQTLLELFSAAADELSDYQDRVMNEAYLGTSRKRVSLARHARLMDYHVHQGNQAATWLALELDAGKNGTLKRDFKVWTGADDLVPTSQVFMTADPARVHTLLGRMGLYTWSDSIPSLAAGSTSADLRVTGAQADANTVRDLINGGEITRLLIQERLNAATGREAGSDPAKRQLLRLITGAGAARSIRDPQTGDWMVRVRWEERDKLKHTYCFTVNCPPPLGRVHDVSFFCGNLVMAYHGRKEELNFFAPGVPLAGLDDLHYEPTDFHYGRACDCTDGPKAAGVGRQYTLCRIPEDRGPLLYRDTTPGGEVPPETTLEEPPRPVPPAEISRPAVTVELPDGTKQRWDERISLVHSDGSDAGGRHFVVETDELGRSLIRFGDGTNGRRLPEGAIVRCTFQAGRPPDGNVGPDVLVRFDPMFDPLVDGATVWNPLDVSNGRAPEPAAEIVRRVPEAYRRRQLRAVTLADYVRRAEEVPGVSRAAARYAWTGSWRTVQVTIDPVGTTTLDEPLRRSVAEWLEAVRLIGEDLEVRPPQLVPLDIRVALCVSADHWVEDVRSELEREFSDSYTPDGRPGFFNPDEWTFGQAIHASQVLGRVQAVEGVEHVISITLKRWEVAGPGGDSILDVRPNEIISVRNDPDHMEAGMIAFDLRGGRQ